MKRRDRRSTPESTCVGVVRLWNDEEGWGVIDSTETPGGCWAHFSHLQMDGYRALVPGRHVDFTWETVRQDGFDFRAVTVRPAS